jgi:hypothetical protein
MKFVLKPVVFILCLLLTTTLPAQPPFIGVKLLKIASGFTSPVGMAAPHDGTNRIFIFEQGGKIKIIQNGKVLDEPFLDISSRLDGPEYRVQRKRIAGYGISSRLQKERQIFPLLQRTAQTTGL